jgi:two-component system cell cycle sensor histidine kinase/response regulator CckA
MADIGRRERALGQELLSLGQHIRDVTAETLPRELANQAHLLDDPVSLSMLETLRAMVFVVDDRGRIVSASPTADSILGRSWHSFLTQPGFSWVHPDDLEVLTKLARRIREDRAPLQATWRVRHGDGHWIWLEASVTRSFRVVAGPTLTIVFARDVSETQEALRALSHSEERFRAMAENASDVVMEVDGNGSILFASPRCANFEGVDPAALVGQSVLESPLWTNMHEADRNELAAAYANTERDELKFECEFRYRHADGALHWMHSTARAFERSDGSQHLVIVGRDVTSRMEAQRQVEESERRHRLLADAALDLITECDGEGRIVYASSSLEAMLGYRPEEFLGTRPVQLTHPDDTNALVEQFLGGLQHHEPVHTEPFRAQHKDGSWRWLTSTGIGYTSPVGAVRYLSVTKDITDERRVEEERRQLEEHLQRTQKLESLGVLAGGIAHDFNNLLTPILGDASLALMDLPEGSASRRRLERIQKAAKRAAALTNQMLAYAGKRPLVTESIDLSSLVRDTAALLESSVAGRASLDFDLSEATPTVDGDPGQLTQVAINLTTNAAEALSEGRGSLVVRTGALNLEHDLSLLGENLKAGSYALLEVADNGAGMDEATRSRIFDPFYSTKFTGRGLGLASALGIVRGHAGGIEVESKIGLGTRMRVLLPASTRRVELIDKPARDASDWRASGTILVVDDDEGVRELTADTLQRAGFDVLCAADGREGIDVFRARADEIRAVLLDRTMPLTGGEEAFAEMRAIRKDARIILVSGYSRERAEQDFSTGELAAFLQKPFLPATLLDLLRSVLEE